MVAKNNVSKEESVEDGVTGKEQENVESGQNDDQDFDENSAFPGENELVHFGLWSPDTVGQKGLKVLLYGQSGVGKTRMAATAPKPLFLDLESGLRSTLSVKPVLRYPADPREEVTSYAQVVEFFNLVKKEKNPTWETIVIDSLNELQVLITQYTVSKFSDVKRQYGDQLTMADYGKANRDFMKIIRLFLKLPYNIIFTAISSSRELEDDQVYPKFVGKQVGPDLQRMMDMIGYCHAKRMPDGSSQHYVSFKITPGYVAKDRLGIVEKDIPNDFSILIEAAKKNFALLNKENE